MSEGICGKSCQQCPQMEAGLCQGCRVGPGNRMNGTCDISKCAREKGHTDCSTCVFSVSCGLLHKKDTMIRLRETGAQREAERKARIAQKEPVLGKWLWLLFWLVVPRTLSSFMTNSTVVALFPVLETPGRFLSIICAFAVGLILIQLREISPRYEIAAVCSLVCTGADLILGLFLEADGMLILLGLLLMGLGIYAQYQTYYAHAEAVEDVDQEMADQWVNLWALYIGVFVALVVCIFLAMISIELAMLAILAVLIAAIVVIVRELKYLYHMAQMFRNLEV